MKTSTLVISVASSAPATAEAIGIAVAGDGAIPKEIVLTRTQLSALGFEGKVGQTLVIPMAGTKFTIAVGIGEAGKADADVMRNAAAALARASSKVGCVSELFL